jgi:hypothetical protein
MAEPRADDHRARREQLGAYVLGHLGDDEAASLRAHLDGCPACRRELDELTPVARRLALGSPDAVVPPPAPPPDLGDRVVARVLGERRERRRRRRGTKLRLAGAGALAGAALSAAALALWPGGDGSTARGPIRAMPAGEAVAFRGMPARTKASATLSPRAWGTEIAINVEGMRPGVRCEVWLVTRSGRRVPAGSFRYVDRYDGSRVVLATSLSRADAVGVRLRAGRWTYNAPLS